MNKVVFISSTFEDLAEYRREVWNVLERLHVTPKGMERFGARSPAPLETCLAEIEQSDIYVGIIAFRLGSIHSDSAKSFTQLEYEHAFRLHKDIWIYLVDEDIARFRKKDIDPDQSRLEAFKRVLNERHTVNKFSTPEDLADKLKNDFESHFPPAVKTGETPVSELESTLALVRRFRLLPQALNGREIRLKILLVGSPFPASRALCKAFNLEYGNTIGIQVVILEPKHDDMNGFKTIYASGILSTNNFLSLVDTRKPADIYARLQFAPDDVSHERAEFFGYEYRIPDEVESGDPDMGYVSPEGKVILLFSKAIS